MHFIAVEKQMTKPSNGFPLCDGFVEGHNVECPFHQAQFSLRDGSVVCGPATEPVKSWPVKMEGGRVFLQLG